MANRNVWMLGLNGGGLFFFSILGNIVTGDTRLGVAAIVAIIVLVIAATALLIQQENIRRAMSNPPADYPRSHDWPGRQPSGPPLPPKSSDPRPTRPPGTVYRAAGTPSPQPHHGLDPQQQTWYVHPPVSETPSTQWQPSRPAIRPSRDRLSAPPADARVGRREFGRLVDAAFAILAMVTSTIVLDDVYVASDNWFLRTLTIMAMAAVYGICKAILKPIFHASGALIYIVTGGLIAIPVNAFLFLLASWISRGVGLPFHIDGFWPAAIVGSLLIAVIAFLSRIVFPDPRTSLSTNVAAA